MLQAMMNIIYIYTRIPKSETPFSTDTTLQDNYSTPKKSTPKTPQQSTSAKMYKLTRHLSHIVHRLYPSMIPPSLNTKTNFKAFSYLMTTH